MALYLLNVSVDTADPNPEYIPEDLTINDQESIVEILVEKVLGYENAIKEYDDNDAEEHNKKMNVKIDFIAQYVVESDLEQLSTETKTQKTLLYTTPLTDGFERLNTPPPKI